MAGTATNAAYAWLYSTLAGDATLVTLLGAARIYRGAAPQGTTFPAIIMNTVSAVTDEPTGFANTWTEMIVQVAVVGEGRSADPLWPVATRVDALLDTKKGVVAGVGEVVLCRRIEEFDDQPIDSGVTRQRVGFRYRIFARGA